MKKIARHTIFAFIVLICNSCITEYVAEIDEENELLVLEGLITDQPEEYIIKISKSLPVGLKSDARPLNGCEITVSDNLDNRIRFFEREPGTYVSPPGFQGEVGRTYKVNILAPTPTGSLNYESYPAEMLPVAEISSVYYEKVILYDVEHDIFDEEACQIYLDTYGGSGSRYLRWEYFETWILRLPFSVPNQKCWVSDRSRAIRIKNTNSLAGASLTRLPLVYISNETDRLKTKYSIMVNQYSMNADEYNFWAALEKLTEQSGGLYDIIPSSITGNLRCKEIPDESVLGYFSVSAKASKRLFIDEAFAGIFDPYTDCITDTVYGDADIPGLDTTVWTLFDKPRAFPNPRTRILTETHGCYDCTDRGTNVKPEYWIGE